MERTRGRWGRETREWSDVCDAIITSFVLLCQSRPLKGGRRRRRRWWKKYKKCLWQTVARSDEPEGRSPPPLFFLSFF